MVTALPRLSHAFRAGLPLLYGHRGAKVELPENTIASFSLALDLGADAIETDAHLTKDGHVVLSHDSSGTRMAGVGKAIGDCTLAEVSQWDAGAGFIAPDGGRPFQGRGYRMPALSDVLDMFPNAHFNVDAKDGGARMVRTLVSLLRRKGAEDRVRIASFSSATLRRVRRLGYRGETGLGRAEVTGIALLPGRWAKRLSFGGTAAQIPLSFGPMRLDTAEMIARFHAHALRVDFWTVNTKAEAERLIALGADGIMTDDVRALAPLFVAMRGANPSRAEAYSPGI